MLGDLRAGPCRQAGVGHQRVHLLQRRERTQAHHTPLGVVRDHHDTPCRLHQTPVRLGLGEVRRGQARLGRYPVHTQEQHVEVERRDRLVGDRADQRVRGRAHPAGEDHRRRALPRPRGALGHVEHVCDPHRVGDHRQIRHVHQPVRQRVRRRPARQRDRGAGRDQLRRGVRDVLLGGRLQTRLGLEPRLVGARLGHRYRAAVHLLQHALPGQRVQVAADRHVRHTELAGQLVDPDPAPAAHLVEDQGASLLREEVRILTHVRSGPFAAPPSDTPTHSLR